MRLGRILITLVSLAGAACAGPTLESCTEFRKMGAAMNPACEDILAQGPPGYDQDESSGGGYSPPTGGTGGPTGD